jgi:hypothetical protein
MPKNGEREGCSAVMCVIRNGEKCAGVEIAETSTREAELMTELGNAAYRRGKQNLYEREFGWSPSQSNGKGTEWRRKTTMEREK